MDQTIQYSNIFVYSKDKRLEEERCILNFHQIQESIYTS